MDIKTTYMGMELKSPLVASPSPLMQDLGKIKELEDAGASAVVLHSLYEEEIQQERHALMRHLEVGIESYAEALSYFPEPETFYAKTDAYLEHITKAQEAVDIPVAVKLAPYYSNMANLAKRLGDVNADALVLFNRFYQPDINLDELEHEPNILLSTSYDMRLPLRWIGILYKQVKPDLAATSGIHTASDVIKMLMVGANITMMTSAALKFGPNIFRLVTDHVVQWMEKHEYESVEQMRGSMSQIHSEDASAFERAQYMKGLKTYIAVK